MGNLWLSSMYVGLVGTIIFTALVTRRLDKSLSYEMTGAAKVRLGTWFLGYTGNRSCWCHSYKWYIKGVFV